MKHEIEKSNKELIKCSCGEYFFPEFTTGDEYWRFLNHKKREEFRDAAKERFIKRDRSELIKKWSGRIVRISRTTGWQFTGIPVWERKIDNYFVLCYFFEREFSDGVPGDELFAVIEEMPDGSLKPIKIGIQIDIVFDGVIRKIEIKEKKLIITCEKECCRGLETNRRRVDLTENYCGLRF